jgi:hypothetical protein
LSNELPLRDGAARGTTGAGSDGDGGSGARGSGGLIPGGGIEGGGAALTVGCAVPGFAGSDGCADAVDWTAVADAVASASCSSFASICAILSPVLRVHGQNSPKNRGGRGREEE